MIDLDTFYQGHWIQDCPTNNDREFDNRPRIKRTTGIPRSMLKAVENPNNGELTQGVMVTPEGGYVVAQPDLYVHLAILDFFLKKKLLTIFVGQGFMAKTSITTERLDGG